MVSLDSGVTTQQRHIEDLLLQRGWQVLERMRPHDPWWLKEVWIATSVWSPQGDRCNVCFLVDPISSPTEADPLVWAVYLGGDLPDGPTPSGAVPLSPRWETRGLQEVARLIDGLRSGHP